jgi:methylenetetrahydrofolate reductase (NADPH)
MKVIEHIRNGRKPNFSYEILPPQKGASIQAVFDIIEKLKPLNPSWINVTSHASSLVYQENIQGQISKKTHKKRPGTIGVCGAIQNKFGIDAVAHILCKGFSKEETENALIELNYLGIHNLLALSGDNLNYDKELSRDKSVNHYSSELVGQINNITLGKFLDETEYFPLDFCVGVAGYPEKHISAPNIDTDIAYLKQKVAAGSEYIITQMFFDNSKYYEFVKKCRAAEINVPIIPGIKVLKSVKQVQSLPKLFHIDLPNELVNELQESPEHAVAIGIAWAAKQVHDLLSNDVNNIHFFLMNDVENVIEIVNNSLSHY